MNIQDPENDPYIVNHEELLERSQFPHFSLHSNPKNGYSIKLSTGEELNLGKVHPAALEHLLSTVKAINNLAMDPKMLSYDRLKHEFGE